MLSLCTLVSHQAPAFLSFEPVSPVFVFSFLRNCIFYTADGPFYIPYIPTKAMGFTRRYVNAVCVVPCAHSVCSFPESAYLFSVVTTNG